MMRAVGRARSVDAGTRRCGTRLLLVLSVALLGACQGFGPRTIGASRGAYNDVIARTDAEQMLGLIVRLRYGDPIGLLNVANVTANLRFGATATSEFGIGSDTNYAGNLVPLQTGVAYEDSPTISYLPVDARAFLRAWLRPLTLDVVVPAVQSGPSASVFLPLLVERINGLHARPDGTPDEWAAFTRTASLLDALRSRGIVAWTITAEDPKHPRFDLVVANYAPEHTAEVAELLRLLSIDRDVRRGAVLRIPIGTGPWLGQHDALVLRTRSVSDILGDASARVDVPAAHLDAGVVAPSPPANDNGATSLRIHSSRKAPESANVAVKHRGYWYYVDDTDLGAKRAFQAVQLLFVSQLTEAKQGTQTSPVLTIPVK